MDNSQYSSALSPRHPMLNKEECEKTKRNKQVIIFGEKLPSPLDVTKHPLNYISKSGLGRNANAATRRVGGCHRIHHN